MEVAIKQESVVVQGVLDAFLSSDPRLEGPWQLRELLGSCSRLPANLTALKEAAARSLALQAASLK